MVTVLLLGLTACGNTISGIGSDITSVGKKVTDWQDSKMKSPSEKGDK